MASQERQLRRYEAAALLDPRNGCFTSEDIDSFRAFRYMELHDELLRDMKLEVPRFNTFAKEVPSRREREDKDGNDP